MLRDHFRPPLSSLRQWNAFHGGWPMKIVDYLVEILPPQYRAEPTVHMGRQGEVDVGTWDSDDYPASPFDEGGVAVAYAPSKPTSAFETNSLDEDEFEVRVYNEEAGEKLVATIEIVSPSNKDRPDSRRDFVRKCKALLARDVSVTILDLVTVPKGNLFQSLLNELGQPVAKNPAGIYAVASRAVLLSSRFIVQSWEAALEIGKPLPTLPLWLSDTLAIPVDYSVAYEQTCKSLRIA